MFKFITRTRKKPIIIADVAQLRRHPRQDEISKFPGCLRYIFETPSQGKQTSRLEYPALGRSNDYRAAAACAMICIFMENKTRVIRPNFVVVMLPSSGKFEILGWSVGRFFWLIFWFFYCIVHEFKLITKCTSFVNQSTMTQSKENISKQVIW